MSLPLRARPVVHPAALPSRPSRVTTETGNRAGIEKKPAEARRTLLKEGFANSHSGRVILHLMCLLRDHKWAWHFAGIRREITT